MKPKLKGITNRESEIIYNLERFDEEDVFIFKLAKLVGEIIDTDGAPVIGAPPKFYSMGCIDLFSYVEDFYIILHIPAKNTELREDINNLIKEYYSW